MGRGQKPPPQFGQTLCRMFSTQDRQKVHSNVHIIASVELGGSAMLQFSQVGLRVCSKITSDFGGSAAWPDARREVLPHGHQEHPRQWAVTDEQRSRWPGAAPPRRAGAVWLSGVVARSLQTAAGYARRSRLARQPNSRQQNRNLFLNRP